MYVYYYQFDNQWHIKIWLAPLDKNALAYFPKVNESYWLVPGTGES